MKPLKNKVSITLDEDVIERIKQLAESDDRSFSQYINMVLKDYLNKNTFIKKTFLREQLKVFKSYVTGGNKALEIYKEAVDRYTTYEKGVEEIKLKQEILEIDCEISHHKFDRGLKDRMNNLKLFEKINVDNGYVAPVTVEKEEGSKYQQVGDATANKKIIKL